MKMNQLRSYQRALALILLVAVLIPVLVVTAYASQKYAYSFTFNYSGDTKYCSGTKTDSAYSAAVSILSANFNGGSVKFQLQRANGSDLSYWAGPYGSTGNYPLYYYANVSIVPPMSVRLAAQSVGNTSYISGNFQP